MPKPIIALLTDFGTKDHYVGVMKGVIKRICPDADLIDLTHHISPQDVRAAAFSLMTNYYYFPEGTVFLVVVDPGVGMQRKPIAVETEYYTFVAPDNGVLSYVLAQESVELVVELEPRPISRMSNTFHGRDVFAPAAARAARGDKLYKIGSVMRDDIRTYPKPMIDLETEDIIGEVLFIDHFGNIVTSIGEFEWLSEEVLEFMPRFVKNSRLMRLSTETKVTIGDTSIEHMQHSYGDVPRGELLTLVGSSHFLEISMNQGNAAQRLGVKVGDQVALKVSEV